LVVVCQPHSWYYSRVSHLPLTIGLTTIFLILPFVCSSHIFHYYDRWVVDANHLWGQLSSRIKNTEGCQPKRSNAIPSRSPHLGIPSCTNPSGRLSVHSVILSSIPVFVSTRAGHRNPYMAYIRRRITGPVTVPSTRWEYGRFCTFRVRVGETLRGFDFCSVYAS
jgi:hypothetical protein